VDNLPEFDIFEALNWYTGGTFTPRSHPDSSWRKLDARLKAEGYTGMQFCHYVAYIMRNGSVGKLIYKNMMCSSGTMEGFLDYAINSLRQAKQRTTAQKRQIRNHVEYGYPLWRLLTEKVIDVNAVVRIEAALKEQKDDEDFDAEHIIQTFGEQAVELMLGVPHYLPYCPHLNKAIKEGRFDVAAFM